MSSVATNLGGGSTYDAGASKVGGGGGGSSIPVGALTYGKATNFHSGDRDFLSLANINGFNVSGVSSIPSTVGDGGAGGSAGVAGSNGVDGYIVILDQNGDLAAETTGSASGWSYTVT